MPKLRVSSSTCCSRSGSRNACPSAEPSVGSVVQVAGRGELGDLERVLGRHPADHDRQVVRRAGRGAERAQLLVEEPGQPLRVQQRLRLLVEERLVGRAAALGHHQELVLRRLRRARCTARPARAGSCRCSARPRTTSAPSASSAGSARRRPRRCPGEMASSSSPPVSTVSVRLPTTIAVPVSWHIGSTPPAATQALRSRSVATNRSLGDASGIVDDGTAAGPGAPAAAGAGCRCTASCTSAVIVAGSISRKSGPAPRRPGRGPGRGGGTRCRPGRAGARRCGGTRAPTEPNSAGKPACSGSRTGPDRSDPPWGARPAPAARRSGGPPEVRDSPPRPPVNCWRHGARAPAVVLGCMPGSILGTSVRRVEDPDLITGASTYVGNLALRRAGLHAGVRPLATGACRDHRRSTPPPRRRRRACVAVFTAADLDAAGAPRAIVLNPELPPPAAGHRPGPVRRRGGRGRGRARRRRPPSTPPSWSTSTTTRCRRSSTPRPRWSPGRRLQFDGARHQPRRRRARPRRRRPARRRRGRRAGPDGEPADGGDADGGQRDRRPARWRGRAARARRSASPPRCRTASATRSRELFGLEPDAGPGDRPARRRRVRRQGRGARRAHRGRRRWPGALGRPVELGGDPLGEPRVDAARPGPGRLLRARADPRRHDHRAAGPGRRRLPAPTPASAAALADRPDLHDGARASTTSPRSASTPPPRSPTPPRWAPSAAPAGPRPPPTWSGSWTSRPPSSGLDPVRDPPAQLHRPRRRSRYDTRSGVALRHRRLRPAAARGAAARRLRQAAGGAGHPAGVRATRCSWASGSASTSRSPPVAAAASSARSTVHADGSATVSAGTSAHGQGHATAFAMLVHRPARHPAWTRSASCSPTPRRCRAAAAPAGRGRCRWAAAPCRRPPTTCWSRPAGARPSCWRRPSTTSSSPTTASSAWPGCPRRR